MKYITFYYIVHFFVFVLANNSEGIFKLICSKCYGTCCIGTAIQSNFIITTKSCAESCQYININNKKVAINKTHVYPHNFQYILFGVSKDSIALIELDSDVAKVSRHVIAIPPESAFGLEAEVIRFDNKISKSLALVKHCEMNFTYYDGYYVCTTKAFRKLQMGAPLLLNNRVYGVMGNKFINTRDYSFMAVAPAIDWIKSSIYSPSSPVNVKDLNVTAIENETISTDIQKQENGITSAPGIDEELDSGPTIKEDEPKTTLLPEKEYESDNGPRETEKELDTGDVETNEPHTSLPVTATASDIGSLETKISSDAGPSDTGAVTETGSPETGKELHNGAPKTEKGLDTLEIENEPDTGPPKTGKEAEYGPETQIDTETPETGTTLVTGSPETKKESAAGLSETGETLDDATANTETETGTTSATGSPETKKESDADLSETGETLDDATAKTETGTTSATGSPETKKESDADLSETGETLDDITAKTGKDQDNATQKTENELDTYTPESENKPTDLPETGNELDNSTPKTEKEPDSGNQETKNESDIGSPETRKEPDNGTPKTESEPESSTPGIEQPNATSKSGNEPDTTRPKTENEPDTGPPETGKESDQDHFENNARYGPSRTENIRYGRQGNSPLRYGRPTKSAKNFVSENYLHPQKKQNKDISPTTNVMEWFNKYYVGDLRKMKPTFVLTTAMLKRDFADLT